MRLKSIIWPSGKCSRLWRIFMVSAVLWLLGDFAYSRYIAYSIRRWEASVPWTSDGYSPHADEYTLGEGETALLMVHGFGDSPQLYRKMAPELANRGYVCRAILLPGFGQDVSSYAESSMEDWLRKLADETETLRTQYERVWIVGHSLGGAISINYVLRQPSQDLEGLVLIAPAVAVSNQRSPLLPTRTWHELSKYLLFFSRTSRSPFHMDAHDPDERERAHRNVFTPRYIVDQTFELIDRNRGRASEIRMPTLVFLSTSDKVVDSGAVENFFEDLGSSRKELVRLERSGHMIPVDFQWLDVVGQIDEFIRQSVQ